MTPEDILPKDKFDTEAVKRLNRYSYEDLETSIPQLLTWIKDMNWPVAKPIAEYLQSISNDISSDINQILKGDDTIWKYWCFHVFWIWPNKQVDTKAFPEIMRIAHTPTDDERIEGLDVLAKQLINYTTRYDIDIKE